MKEIMCFIKQIKIIFYLYMYHAATFLLRKRKLSHHTVYLCEISGSESVLGFFLSFQKHCRWRFSYQEWRDGLLLAALLSFFSLTIIFFVYIFIFIRQSKNISLLTKSFQYSTTNYMKTSD